MTRSKDRIAVVGAGQMGNGIAHVFAQSGHDVTMIDVSRDALARGRDTMAKNLDRQVKKGTITADDKEHTLARVATAESLEAVSAATVVIEAVTEQRDLKFRIFGDIDRFSAAGRNSRDQHQLHLDHGDRGSHHAAGRR